MLLLLIDLYFFQIQKALQLATTLNLLNLSLFLKLMQLEMGLLQLAQNLVLLKLIKKLDREKPQLEISAMLNAMLSNLCKQPLFDTMPFCYGLVMKNDLPSPVFSIVFFNTCS